MGANEVVDDAQPHIESASDAKTLPSREEMSLTIWETVKNNHKAIAYSLLLSTGPMLYGFDIIVVSLVIAMPSFQAAFGTQFGDMYLIPAVWQALWTSMIQVGAMGGALTNGAVVDRFGRKFAFGFCSIVAMIGILIVYVSDLPGSLEGRRAVFLTGKIVVGYVLGGLNSNSVIFISEIAPARVRGPLLSCFTLFIIVSQVIEVAAVFARIAILDASSYRVCFASQWVLAGIVFIVAIIVPESPVYLIRRNKLTKAAKAYNRLYPISDSETKLVALQIAVKHEMLVEQNQKNGSYIQCFKGTNWRRTRIIVWANILQQFVSITMVANATYFLELAGMSPGLVLTLTFVELSLGIPAILVSWVAMTVWGRRALLLLGSGIIGIIWLGMGVAGCFPTSTGALWFLGVGLIVIYVIYALSVGAAYRIGFFAQFVFAWLFSFTVPYMFSPDAGNLGGKVGLIFGFLSVVGFAIVWFDIREMNNRTFAELDEIFEKKLPTRQFSGYVCSGILRESARSEKASV